MIVFDIDGTLADEGWRHHHIAKAPKDWDAYHKASVNDQVIRPMREVFWAIRARNFLPVEFWTGRPETYREETETWLTNEMFNGNATWTRPGALLYTPLRMRPSQNFGKSSDLKLSWAQEKKPSLVFEDNLSVAKALKDYGIPVLLMYPGS